MKAFSKVFLKFCGFSVFPSFFHWIKWPLKAKKCVILNSGSKYVPSSTILLNAQLNSTGAQFYNGKCSVINKWRIFNLAFKDYFVTIYAIESFEFKSNKEKTNSIERYVGPALVCNLWFYQEKCHNLMGYLFFFITSLLPWFWVQFMVVITGQKWLFLVK